MTDTGSDWDARMQAGIRFCDDMLRLAPLRALAEARRRRLVRIFWLYHLILAVVMTLNVGVRVVAPGILFWAGLPLMLAWGLYAFHFVAVYMPMHMFADLYHYFRKKNCGPGRAMMVSVLLLAGAIVACTFEFWLA